METTSGIDFGTSNSAAAYTENGEVKLVNVENGNYSIPSALFFYKDSIKTIYGNDALKAFLTHVDGRFMRSMKTILGSSLMDSGTWINNNPVFFQTIIGYFITHLKSKLDTQAGKPVDTVVMGRPVKFNESDETLDKKAEEVLGTIARKSGFKFVEFQYEPVAAAFSHERNIAGEKLAAVIDIGGGTSDFTVIRLGDKLKNKADRKDDILANTGTKVGGNTFDKNLCLSSFMPLLGMDTTLGSRKLPMPSYLYFELSDWNEINIIYTNKTTSMLREIYHEANNPVKVGRLVDLVSSRRAHELLNVVEQTKIKLTLHDSVESILTPVNDKPSVMVSRSDFDTCAGRIYEMIQHSLDDCLAQAGKKSTDIDIVILTGGSTEIIRIKDMVHAQFPNARISDKNKFSSVCEGLAYDAMRKFPG